MSITNEVTVRAKVLSETEFRVSPVDARPKTEFDGRVDKMTYRFVSYGECAEYIHKVVNVGDEIIVRAQLTQRSFNIRGTSKGFVSVQLLVDYIAVIKKTEE